MKKSDIIKAIATTTRLNATQVSTVLEALTDVIVSELKTNKEITVHGLGVFKLKQRAARQGKNPRTGEVIQIPERTVLSVKSAAIERAALNV